MPVDIASAGSAFAAAQTISERLSRPVCAGPDSPAWARQRLREWCAAVSFDQAGSDAAEGGWLLATRLAAAGLDEPTPTALLAAEGAQSPGPEAGAAGGGPDADVPVLPWVRELRAADPERFPSVAAQEPPRR